MQAEYTTLADYGTDEFVEKRSRFIGYAKPVTTEEEAIAFIGEIRASTGRPATMSMPMPCGKGRCAGIRTMASPREPRESRCWMCCRRAVLWMRW